MLPDTTSNKDSEKYGKRGEQAERLPIPCNSEIRHETALSNVAERQPAPGNMS